MRLSTAADRDETRAVAVIHAALDAGVRWLDTADVYGHGEHDIGHNERLVARALGSWPGDRSQVTVATKGGLVRRGSDWAPDGRAKHLRAACEASRIALGVSRIDLYQLHAVDPATPLRTSVRALADLRERGLIARVGLSNVTVGQIEEARRIVDVHSVQLSLSVRDASAFRGGVVDYCRDHGIVLLAHRPLGGAPAARLDRDPDLAAVAEQYGVSAQEIALAWVIDRSGAVPLAGATAIDHARSLERIATIVLDDDDRARLDSRFAPRSARVMGGAPVEVGSAPDGEIVLVLGMPGSGKSTLARELEGDGYTRLNRDERGGSIAQLADALRDGLANGARRWVLDNTYPTRASRHDVVRHGQERNIPVRCIWVRTSMGDAQVNAIDRMIAVHGALPSPEEIRARGKADTRYLLPDALFRWERTFEQPVLDEGFSSIEARDFVREPNEGNARALMLEVDDVLMRLRGGAVPLDAADVEVDEARATVLREYASNGWALFAHAWRPQLAAGASPAGVGASFERLRELFGVPITIRWCPHEAGPPRCWCRKPLPGFALEFARANDVSLRDSVVVGRSPADRTMAQRLGATYSAHENFFGGR